MTYNFDVFVIIENIESSTPSRFLHLAPETNLILNQTLLNKPCLQAAFVDTNIHKCRCVYYWLGV